MPTGTGLNTTGQVTEYFGPIDPISHTAGGTISNTGSIVSGVTPALLVELSADRTVTVAGANAVDCVGVAMHDAVTGDTVSVARRGVWPMKTTNTVGVGDTIVCGAAGLATGITADGDPRFQVGIALEAIASGAIGRVMLKGRG